MTKKNNHITQNTKELSILVSMYGLSFMVKKAGEKKFFEYTFPFSNPSGLNIELQKILDERGLLQQNFDRISIIHHNQLNTLVPRTFFNHEATKTYLTQNIHLLEDDVINHEAIHSIEAVNIYIPFNPLQIDFDLNKMAHTHSTNVFFDNIAEVQSQQQKIPVFEIYINVFPKDFQIAVFKNQSLQAYNHFQYENTDEFLYYLFFVTETLALEESKSQIYVMGIEQSDTLLETLNTFTTNINVLPAKTPSQINNYI